MAEVVEISSDPVGGSTAHTEYKNAIDQTALSNYFNPMKTDKQSIAKITTVKELQTEAAKQFWGNFSDYVNNNIKDFSGQIADSMYEFIVSRAEEILQIVERVPVSETEWVRYFITSHLRFKHCSSNRRQGTRSNFRLLF